MSEASCPSFPSRLVRYFHDCLAAQCDWGRAINVLAPDDVTLLPLAAKEQQHLGTTGSLRLTDPETAELAKRMLAGGADRALVLGALFIVGRQPAREDRSEKRFCAPLLKVAIKLQEEAAGVYVIEPEESEFTVNYSMVGELLGDAPEDDDLQDRMADLARWVPDFPIDAEEFGAFWNAFHCIAPELPLSDQLPRPRRTPSDQPSRIATLGIASEPPAKAWQPKESVLPIVDFYVPEIASDLRFRLLPATALLYGRLPGREMSALNELREMETADLSRTAFACLFDPQHARVDSPQPRIDESTDEALVTEADYQPLPLSPAQRLIVNSARVAPLTVVTGPPGTGKSYTISAIVLDAILRGEKVLVASQMDKAVEVVAEMTESLAGPLAIARSGGRAAQRALARKVSKLTGPINQLPSVSEAMIRDCRRQHAAAVEAELRLEQSLAGIVASELSWSEINETCQRAEVLCPLPIAALPPRDARRSAAYLEKLLQAESDPPGWLGRLLNRWRLSRLRASLQLPDSTPADLPQLEQLVQLQLLRAERSEIESSLRAPFPANLAWREMVQSQDRRQQLAIELVRLTRAAQIRDLVSADHARSALRDLARLLRRRRHDLKRNLQQNLSAELLLNCFPAWACTSRSLCEVLPATAGLFDLVIIDEASQCDLALASVALMRAKRAVVVGDPQQLRHVCFLSHAREHAAVLRSGLSPQQHHRFGYRRSLFDVAADMVDQRHFFFLDEHYRSRPPIIDFSNRRFYEQAMRIMTRRPSNRVADAIELLRVEGRRREDSSVNEREIEAVIATIQQAIETSPQQSIGIVSPFRDHADAIKERLLRELTSEQMKRHGVVIGTAHSLQGDEKDLVIFTTSIDEDSHPASLRFLESPNLFNVAITRARRRLVVITSRRTEDLPPGLLRDFLVHAANTSSEDAPNERWKESDSEGMPQTLRQQLSARGWNVWADVQSAATQICLAAGRDHGELAVHCDTASQQRQSAETIAEDQRRLRRAGWQVIRIPHRTFAKNLDACVAEIEKHLERG